MPAAVATRPRMRVTIWRSSGRPALVSNRPVLSRCAGGEVVGDELDELGVQRDVAVVVELAEGDSQPVCVADAYDGVGLQGAQLPDAQTGAGQKLHH